MDGIALLKWVTLIYVAVLVLAVATVLITIAVYLWRIAGVAARIRDALSEVRDRTAPLQQHLAPLEDVTEEHVRRLDRAVVKMEQAAGIRNESTVIEEQVARL